MRIALWQPGVLKLSWGLIDIEHTALLWPPPRRLSWSTDPATETQMPMFKNTAGSSGEGGDKPVPGSERGHTERKVLNSRLSRSGIQRESLHKENLSLQENLCSDQHKTHVHKIKECTMWDLIFLFYNEVTFTGSDTLSILNTASVAHWNSRRKQGGGESDEKQKRRRRSRCRRKGRRFEFSAARQIWAVVCADVCLAWQMHSAVFIK